MKISRRPINNDEFYYFIASGDGGEIYGTNTFGREEACEHWLRSLGIPVSKTY